MAKSQRTTFAKLQRDRARQAKQAEKRERRRAKAAGELPPDPDATADEATEADATDVAPPPDATDVAPPPDA